MSSSEYKGKMMNYRKRVEERKREEREKDNSAEFDYTQYMGIEDNDFEAGVLSLNAFGEEMVSHIYIPQYGTTVLLYKSLKSDNEFFETLKNVPNGEKYKFISLNFSSDLHSFVKERLKRKGLVLKMGQM